MLVLVKLFRLIFNLFVYSLLFYSLVDPPYKRCPNLYFGRHVIKYTVGVISRYDPLHSQVDFKLSHANDL